MTPVTFPPSLNTASAQALIKPMFPAPFTSRMPRRAKVLPNSSAHAVYRGSIFVLEALYTQTVFISFTLTCFTVLRFSPFF
jgi:hypothetical protein